MNRREQRLGWLFVAPWIVGFLTFTLYPLLASLYLSFTDYRVLTPPIWVGLRNYRELLADKEMFWPSLGNTAFLFLELPLALLLGLAIALLLNLKLRGTAIYRTLCYLPSVVPTVAVAMLWLWLLNPEFGLVNAGLRAIGLPAPSWLSSPEYAKPAIILMDLWGVGGGIVLYLAALQGVPASLQEAAALDGAGPLKRLVHVTLPAISPVIFFNLIMGVVGTFQYFTQTWVMTRGGPDNATLFYALHLYRNAFEYFKMGTACAMAWILFALTLAATLLVFKTSARWVYYEGDRS
ncbi:MAG: carbohydrate ABC transporter permease [Armatimonadota bacterium]